MDADVLVIGGGLAGLVATAELAAEGRSVIVIDAEPLQSLGGQAYWSLGGLFGVDTAEQRRLRIHDSIDLAWSDWLGSAGFDRDEDYWPRQWAEAFVNFAGGEQQSWLRSLGVRMFPVVQWAERGGYASPGHGNSVPRFHLVWGTGPGVVEPFSRAVLKSHRVRLRNRHRVTDLVVDDTGVTVSGDVLAFSDAPRGVASPSEVTGQFGFTAPAAVIASGGIGGNLDLVRENWPRAYGSPPENLLCGVPDFVDGSMLAIAQRTGARLINADRMWHYPEGILNHAPLWTHHGIRLLPGPSSIWLDARGTRFPAPLFPGFDALGALRHVTASGYDYSWFVLDTEIMGREFGLSGSEQNGDLTGKDLGLLAGRLKPGPTPEVRAFADYGVDFLTAASVPELAAKMNQLAGVHLIDAAALQTTLEQHDLQIRSGLGKDPQVVAITAARKYLGDRVMRVAAPHEMLDPARPGEGAAGRGGPLVAVRLHVLTRKTLGGLETDLSGRVLRGDGSAVPGLYAVGEAAGFGGGGMHGYRALEGTFLGGCLFTGRITGRALAAAL